MGTWRCVSFVLLLQMLVLLAGVQEGLAVTAGEPCGVTYRMSCGDDPCSIYQCVHGSWMATQCQVRTKCRPLPHYPNYVTCDWATFGRCSGITTTPPTTTTSQTTPAATVNTETVEESTGTTPAPTTTTTGTTTTPPEKEYVVMCNYPTWGRSRPENGTFEVEDVDVSMCTHIVYAYGGMDSIGNVFHGFVNDSIFLPELMALRDAKPGLKIILSLGGSNAGWPAFLSVSRFYMPEFVNNVTAHLRENGFDGLEVDWEFPFNMMSHFTTLIQGLRNGFDAEAELEGLPRLELNAAFSAGKAVIDWSYDIEAIHESLDYMIIMTYNLKIAPEGKAAHHCGLWTAYNGSIGDDATRNQDWVMNYFQVIAEPANIAGKLVMGIPTYGRTFLLSDASQNTPGSAASGAMPAGPISGDWSYLAYHEICSMVNTEPGWTRVYDSEADAPYYYNGNKWISYVDAESAQHKVDYIREKKLGGASVWNLIEDDFNNVCGDGANPILNTMADLSP